MAPRSTSSATLYFGLVAVPVKIYTATSEEDGIHFQFLHRDCGAKPKQQYFCERDHSALTSDDLVKGFEIEPGRYVTFERDELKALEETATSAPAVEICEFVALALIDPVHWDKAHHLAPEAGGERAYCVVAAALESAGRVGLGRYSARGKQHFVAVRATGGRLVLQQLLRAERVRPASEIPFRAVTVGQPELDLALQVVERRASEAFRADAYPDVVRERMLARIQEKVAGKQVTLAPVDERPVFVDLLEALKASVQLGERRGPKRAERAAPRAAAAPRTRVAGKK